MLHGGTGIADEDMRRAIACGTAKINVNTENMYAWCQQVKAIFAADTGHDVNDPRKVIAQGLQPVTRDDCPPHGALWLRAALLTPGLRLETTAPTLPGRWFQVSKSKAGTAQHTPQKACSSETGIDDLRAISC